VEEAIVKNGYENTLGFKIGIFTNYCGPGDVAGPSNATVCGVFNKVDNCCKIHDACEDYIVSKADFARYQGLPHKHLYFTSLNCKCDVAFYNCISQTATFFGDLILGIYGVAQMSCFQHDYKIEKCIKYDE
jgi:Phospholipase A2